MCDWSSLVTSSNFRLVLLLLSDWSNFGGIPLVVDIPCSWLEPASGAPDGRFKHSARAQGVGAGLASRGKTAMWEFPHTCISLERSDTFINSYSSTEWAVEVATGMILPSTDFSTLLLSRYLCLSACAGCRLWNKSWNSLPGDILNAWHETAYALQTRHVSKYCDDWPRLYTHASLGGLKYLSTAKSL
jgi:hypothetical protein